MSNARRCSARTASAVPHTRPRASRCRQDTSRGPEQPATIVAGRISPRTHVRPEVAAVQRPVENFVISQAPRIAARVVGSDGFPTGGTICDIDQAIAESSNATTETVAMDIAVGDMAEPGHPGSNGALPNSRRSPDAGPTSCGAATWVCSAACAEPPWFVDAPPGQPRGTRRTHCPKLKSRPKVGLKMGRAPQET